MKQIKKHIAKFLPLITVSVLTVSSCSIVASSQWETVEEVVSEFVLSDFQKIDKNREIIKYHFLQAKCNDLFLDKSNSTPLNHNHGKRLLILYHNLKIPFVVNKKSRLTSLLKI